MGRPTDCKKEHRLGVRVSDETYTKLNMISEKTKKSKTDLIRRGIELVFEENS